MSEKKMTDEELAKISGAGDKKPAGDHDLIDDDPGTGGGGGTPPDSQVNPPANPGDVNRT